MLHLSNDKLQHLKFRGVRRRSEEMQVKQDEPDQGLCTLQCKDASMQVNSRAEIPPKIERCRAA